MSKWIQTQTRENMTVHWLDLSMFDLQSGFTIEFNGLVWDINIVRDSMTVSRIDNDGNYHKVKFHSDAEFEIFFTEPKN